MPYNSVATAASSSSTPSPPALTLSETINDLFGMESGVDGSSSSSQGGLNLASTLSLPGFPSSSTSLSTTTTSASTLPPFPLYPHTAESSREPTNNISPPFLASRSRASSRDSNFSLSNTNIPSCKSPNLSATTSPAATSAPFITNHHHHNDNHGNWDTQGRGDASNTDSNRYSTQQSHQSIPLASTTLTPTPLVGMGSLGPNWDPDYNTSTDSIARGGQGQGQGSMPGPTGVKQGQNISLGPSITIGLPSPPPSIHTQSLQPPISISSSTISSPSSAASNSGFKVVSRTNRYTPPASGASSPLMVQTQSSNTSSASTSPSIMALPAVASVTPPPLSLNTNSTYQPFTAPVNTHFVTSPVSVNSTPQPKSRTQSIPRRPSLLTQQILCSPAIPQRTAIHSQGSYRGDPGTDAYGSYGRASALVGRSTSGSSSAGAGELSSSSEAPRRKESLKDRLFPSQAKLEEEKERERDLKGKGKEREDNGVEAMGGGGGQEVLRVDTSVAGINGINRQQEPSTSLTTGTRPTSGQPTRLGSLQRGRSYGQMGGGGGGDGSRTPLSSETAEGEDEVIETADLMFTKDQRSGRKMINQYLILREIGRGQHGQVRLGQDLSTPEASRTPSMIGMNGDSSSIPQPSHGSGSNSGASSYTTTGGVLGGISPVDSAIAPNTAVGQQGNFWAIKIVDRQPKKKLPGMRRFGTAGSGAVGHMGEASVANEKLKREIAILKKCRHPNVVRLREVIDASISKKIYLILEYCEGGEVKWKSDDGKPLLTVGEARRVFRDIVLGLEYLHHQGIIHRDIKPANLLYSREGVVKISDFGVSHYSHVLRGTREDGSTISPEDDEPAFMDDHDLAKTAGSPAFFAPELCYNGDGTPSGASTPSANNTEFNFPPQPMDSLANRLSALSNGSATSTLRTSGAFRRKRPPITEAIDIWALGVTLYCFLFGLVPFDSTSEYALFSIIPTEDFAVPDYMGADGLWTGGRTAFKQAQNNDVSEEVCEVLDLLERLLEKDPVKRIKLDVVKRHPFTLREINDHSAWLASTDPTEDTFVTVSTDEVAAAVTNSGSFKKFVRRSVKQLGHKLNFFSSGSGAKSRSRSTSLIQPAEGGHLAFPGDPSSAISSGIPSQAPSPIIHASGRVTSNPKSNSRTVSGNSVDNANIARAASPHVTGNLSRQISWLQPGTARPNNDRARSPLPGTVDISKHFQSASQVALPASSDDFDYLGRSVSTTSSSAQGHRMAPTRRQSTHLAPPPLPPLGHSSMVRKPLSASASAEALDMMIAKGIVAEPGVPLSAKAMSLRRKQSVEVESLLGQSQGRVARQRSESNASSGGLHRIARLFSRNISQKGSSASSNVSLSHKSSEFVRGPGIGETASDRALTDEGRSPQEEPSEDLQGETMSEDGLFAGNLSRKPSAETFASSLYMSSRTGMSSTDLHHSALPPVSHGEWDGRQALGLTPEQSYRPDLRRASTERPTPSLPMDTEEADWNGNLSDDDDEDYGQDAISSLDRVPNSIDDLQTGTWKLDGNGWRGSNLATPTPNSRGREGLGLTIPEDSVLEPVGSVSVDDRGTDSPNTITGPKRTWGSPVATTNAALPSSPDSNKHLSPPTSPIHPTHADDLRRRSFSRTGIRSSPLRLPDRGIVDRARSPLGLSSRDMPSSPRFMDAFDTSSECGTHHEEEEDEGDDEVGLEMDFGKRGRRASSRLATPINLKSS